MMIAQETSPVNAQGGRRSVERSTALDDLVDEFCYELALVLRRILNLDKEEAEDDENTDD